MAVLHQVTFIAPPSAGKTTLAERLRDHAGYALVGVDQLFERYCANGAAPGTAKVITLIDLPAYRAIAAYKRQSVAVDGGGLDVSEADFLVSVHPKLKSVLASRGDELRRLIMTLEVDTAVLAERDRLRGYTPEQCEGQAQLRSSWRSPIEYQDAEGQVPVLRFPNNTFEEQQAIYRALCERLSVPLL